MNKSKKSCVSCQYFSFNAGSYDEATEMGTDWSMNCTCEKIIDERWMLTGVDVTQDMLRNTLLIARSCKFYKDVKDASEVIPAEAIPVTTPEEVAALEAALEVAAEEAPVVEVPEVEAVTNE